MDKIQEMMATFITTTFLKLSFLWLTGQKLTAELFFFIYLNRKFYIWGKFRQLVQFLIFKTPIGSNWLPV